MKMASAGLVLALGVLMAAPPFAVVRAQAPAAEDALQGTFITPFPENDTYRIQLIGDWWVEGMIEGLAEGLGDDTRVQLNRKHRAVNSVYKPDFEEDMRLLDDMIGRERPHVVVIMLGIADRVSVRLPNGRRAAIGSDEWRAEYTRRIDRLIRAVRKPNVAVYWVSQPKLRREEADEDAQKMNEIVRERTYLNGFKYIDVHAAFSDEAGNFNAYGPDLTGKMRLLRDPEGVGFTGTGYRKLAHYVEREVKRDIGQARNERSIPLAGTEAEQARVNPQKVAADAAKAAAAAGQAAPASLPGAAPAPGSGLPGRSQNAGLEQKADNGRIALKVQGANGRDESVQMEILRPAIPASVIALVTRRQVLDKAAQQGDVLPEDIPGGLTLLSTITPVNESSANRRRQSPTQTPYFRVLVKGEWQPPRAGRTDDFSWPRVDAAAPVQPTAAPAGAGAADASQPAPPRPGPAVRPRGPRGAENSN